LSSASQLTDLRAAVERDTNAWNTQEGELVKAVNAVAAAKAEVVTAQEELDDAVTACQVAQFDKYRETLEDAMVARNRDLATIKALIQAAADAKPAAGTAGARCEKALSNGTWRPKRGEETCAEGLCCGASRVWMDAGAGTGSVNAAWRTVETCQSEEASSYMYQPMRGPMAIQMPDKVEVSFTCIQGAKTLAAAASAVAAAVYMLA
jgi:hypothetical protein